MERNNPLISVVTVSYNAVSVIEQTIFSVINQTYPMYNNYENSGKHQRFEDIVPR